MTTQQTPSAEEQMRAIIEAQVKGGYWMHEVWKDELDAEEAYLDMDGPCVQSRESNTNTAILVILLDPEGLKAAWPGWACEDCGDGGQLGLCPAGEDHPFRTEAYKHVAYDILDSWLSGGPEAAIKTAFDLLPQKA